LIPGDLLIAGPILFLVSPKMLSSMAVRAGNGGLIRWQSGIATPIGRFQFVFDREVGVSFYGTKENGPLVPGNNGTVHISYSSTKFDITILEYNPFRTFSMDQSSSMIIQLTGCIFPAVLFNEKNYHIETTYLGMTSQRVLRMALVPGLVSLGTGIILWFAAGVQQAGIFLIAGLALLAVTLRGYPSTRGFSFTVAILTTVTLSLYHPEYFEGLGDFSFKSLIVPLLQMIMFGMGCTMGPSDFAGVMRMPKGVVVGVVCQFTIMPLVGYAIAHLFGFPSEIAAGIILVGSVPSGLASNVMSYIANANVALSVTLTAFATLLAPLMTPLLMQLLAGEYVPVDFLSMMLDILKIVILPIGAGLLFHHFLSRRLPAVTRVMPVLSMASIAVIITIITAAGRESLLVVGPLLLLACLLHNVTGYFLGYLTARFLKMDEKSCRTVALEVGLQNAGLASGLAHQMGRIATVGLAAAVFGPLMNITGSSLATWWHNRPVKE
jgi:BASS family bile acid:Na+ symporter